jgi:hypothetical protein
MGITIDFKKKIIVNGQEYHSWEEVPEAVRRLVDPASGQARDPSRSVPGSKQAIVFNGKEYADLAAMPEDERHLFEAVMKTLKHEEGAPVQNEMGMALDPGWKNQGGGNVTVSLDSYRKLKPSSPSFSSTWLLRGGVVLLLLWLLYTLWK